MRKIFVLTILLSALVLVPIKTWAQDQMEFVSALAKQSSGYYSLPNGLYVKARENTAFEKWLIRLENRRVKITLEAQEEDLGLTGTPDVTAELTKDADIGDVSLFSVGNDIALKADDNSALSLWLKFHTGQKVRIHMTLARDPSTS